MPNWVDTSFEVHGPTAEVKRFRDGLTKDDDGTYRIIESYLPTPEALKITSTTAWEEIPEKWQAWVADGTWTQEDCDKRIAENNELLAQQKSNLATYGYKDWYDWTYAEWGTKWGDCHTDIHDFVEPEGDVATLSGTFDTAWGPADTAFIKISKMFPELFFVFTYDEEAGFFAGIQVFRNGESVFDSMYEPCSYEGETDWEDEEQMNKYYDWKNENLDRITDEFMAFMRKAMK
jgi:hypothetical protein